MSSYVSCPNLVEYMMDKGNGVPIVIAISTMSASCSAHATASSTLGAHKLQCSEIIIN